MPIPWVEAWQPVPALTVSLGAGFLLDPTGVFWRRNHARHAVLQATYLPARIYSSWLHSVRLLQAGLWVCLGSLGTSVPALSMWFLCSYTVWMV